MIIVWIHDLFFLLLQEKLIELCWYLRIRLLHHIGEGVQLLFLRNILVLVLWDPQRLLIIRIISKWIAPLLSLWRRLSKKILLQNIYILVLWRRRWLHIELKRCGRNLLRFLVLRRLWREIEQVIDSFNLGLFFLFLNTLCNLFGFNVVLSQSLPWYFFCPLESRKNFFSQLIFLLLVNLDDLGPVHREHRSVVREFGLSSVVVERERGLVVIPIIWVWNQLFFVLTISAKENSVAPCRYSHLLRSVVYLTISVVFVSWVKVQRTFYKLAQDVVLWLEVDKLVVALEPIIVFFVN